MTAVQKRKLEEIRGGLTERGFTLLELMIVITIIGILAAISVGRYEQSVLRAREAALHYDLAEMRKAIQNYTLDKEDGPASLEDLHTAGYIGDVPADPMTRQKDWNTTESCGAVLSPDQTLAGICDVHSSSDQVSPFESTPYSTW
jgi:general secretion pathway protein G